MFLDGYCSTVQGLLDWFEVDLGFTELWFTQIDLCVMCVFVLYSHVSLSSCPFLDILHCLPRAVGVPLESALNLVSRMSPCGAYDTHYAVLRVTITCSIGYNITSLLICTWSRLICIRSLLAGSSVYFDKCVQGSRAVGRAVANPETERERRGGRESYTHTCVYMSI